MGFSVPLDKTLLAEEHPMVEKVLMYKPAPSRRLTPVSDIHSFQWPSRDNTRSSKAQRAVFLPQDLPHRYSQYLLYSYFCDHRRRCSMDFRLLHLHILDLWAKYHLPLGDRAFRLGAVQRDLPIFYGHEHIGLLARSVHLVSANTEG